MNVTADEGLKALTVGKLDIKPAAVAFNATEGVELALVPLIIDRAKMPPVDLKAIAGAGFDPHISARGIPDLAQSSHVFLENRLAARVTKRLYALPDNDRTGPRPLIQQFPDYGLKGIQLAATWFPDRRFCMRIGQVFPDGSAANMKLAGNLPA
jgi:hypothetical protein